MTQPYDPQAGSGPLSTGWPATGAGGAPSGVPWATHGQPGPWPGVPPGYVHPQPESWSSGPWPAAPHGTLPRGRRQWPLVAAVVASGVLVVGLVVALVIGSYHLGQSVQATPSFPMQAPPTSPAASPAGLGDDPGLDGYAERCHDGDMGACDDLYHLSDVLSDYEHYGMTCGGRVKPFDVGACTDLE